MEGLRQYLRSLKGKSVRLDRGGPESLQGYLVEVHGDYVTLAVDGGYVHYPLHHVKSITSYLFQGNGQAQVAPAAPAEGLPAMFRDLLQSWRGSLVRINQGGPEACVGLLHDVVGDQVLLADSRLQTLILYPIFHIRSVTRDLLERKGQQQGQKQEDRGKEEGAGTGAEAASGAAAGQAAAVPTQEPAPAGEPAPVEEPERELVPVGAAGGAAVASEPAAPPREAVIVPFVVERPAREAPAAGITVTYHRVSLGRR